MVQKLFYFQKLLFHLAQNLVSKLLPSINVFTESKVASYYDDIKFKDLNFEFSETSTEKNIKYFKRFKPI